MVQSNVLLRDRAAACSLFLPLFNELHEAVEEVVAVLGAGGGFGVVLDREDRLALDLQPLEPIRAKGFEEPVPVYHVLAAKPRSFRTRRRGVEGVETTSFSID